MTQECAPNAYIPTVGSFDAQTCSPLSESETRLSRNHSEVEDRHEKRQQDSGSLSGISGRSRAAAEHTGDESAQDQEGNECDVVD